jgi:hypothetical protein
MTAEASPFVIDSGNCCPDSRAIRRSTAHCASDAGSLRQAAPAFFAFKRLNRLRLLLVYDTANLRGPSRASARVGHPSAPLRVHLRAAASGLCVAGEHHRRLYLGTLRRLTGLAPSQRSRAGRPIRVRRRAARSVGHERSLPAGVVSAPPGSRGRVARLSERSSAPGGKELASDLAPLLAVRGFRWPEGPGRRRGPRRLADVVSCVYEQRGQRQRVTAKPFARRR